jgi:hypothetical protein
MNEDKMIAMLSNLDDDLVDNEIDKLMDGVECDMESVKRKAHQKLEKHNRKMKVRKRLPYVAAVLACFICINVTYADEISTAIKSFLNKTPIYSTMVDGTAYYLEDSLVLDDNLTIESIIVSKGKLDMEYTSNLPTEVLEDMKIVSKDDPDTQYVMAGFSKNGDKYVFSFANGKEKNYNIKPFKAFNLVVGDKTYSVTLDQANKLDSTQKLSTSEESNYIDIVDVGANSIEKNGKKAVQLIASFQDVNMKLSAFGQPVTPMVKTTVENLGKDGIVSHSNTSKLEDLYATDESGTKYKLKVPADVNAYPVTTFETGTAKDSKLTINVPALLATYEKTVDSIRFSIPKDDEKILNHDVDLFAQKAVVKSIKRLSPTSAKLVFQLNTGTEKNVSIRSFQVYSKNIKKISSEFNGDTAIMTLEFDKGVDVADLDISWPVFVMNGNWMINIK